MISKLTGAAAAAVIVATAIFWLVAEYDRRSAPTIEISAPRNNQPIIVEIAGAVAMPGVYELRQQDRVDDLIQSAGGLLPEAEISGLNRAAILIDGQRVTVPFQLSTSTGFGSEIGASPEAGQLLNINTATTEELDALPGIGEVRAAAIVNHRNQHGPFTSVDELLLVEGISENLLDQIRPFVTVSP